MATPQPTPATDVDTAEPLPQEELVKCLDKPLTSREFTVVRGMYTVQTHLLWMLTSVCLQKLVSRPSSLSDTCSRYSLLLSAQVYMYSQYFR